MVAETTAVKIATEYFMISDLYIGFVGRMMRCVTMPVVSLYLYTISRKTTGLVYTLKRGINSHNVGVEIVTILPDY